MGICVYLSEKDCILVVDALHELAQDISTNDNDRERLYRIAEKITNKITK